MHGNYAIREICLVTCYCHNYRPITLTPIINKAHEHLMLLTRQDYFIADDLQCGLCGFKRGVGRSDALFAARNFV